MIDLKSNPEVRAWLEDMEARIATDLRPKMESCAFALIPVDKDVMNDPWMLMQVGMAVLLDKPLVLIVTDGTPIPSRAYDIADTVIHTARTDSGEAIRDKVQTAVESVLRKRGIT